MILHLIYKLQWLGQLIFRPSSAAHAVVTRDVVGTEKCCSGQPTQQLPAGSRDPLERDPGRPDGPLDRAARQYWRWGRAGCHPGAIQAGVENVDSVAVKNRLKKSARIAPVLTAQEGRSGAAVAS